MRTTITVKAPRDMKAGESFQVTIDGTGITADIRSFTREYAAKHNGATVDDVAKAYLAANPKAKLATVMTQVRAAL